MPAAHPYVDAVVDREAVVLLPDPVPPGATSAAQWWPPQWLDRGYVLDNAHRAEVVHVHFGFDTEEPRDLEHVAATLRGRGVPLIVTVHDLHNPHFPDAAAHAARLDVLVPAADAVVTLTEGAAEEIRARWNREAVVMPHPHVLPIDDVGASRPSRDTPVVAVHAKALRANVDPWPVLDALVSADRRGWRLRLDVDADAMTSPRSDEVGGGRLDAYRAAGVDVRVHRRFDDAELVGYLRDVDVLVLPYRFGSHSGWVEACFDAGVQTVVPNCGYFHQQQRSSVFGFDGSLLDVDALRSGVAEALRRVAEAPTGADVERRRHRAAQRRAVRRDTAMLYHRVLAERAAA